MDGPIVTLLVVHPRAGGTVQGGRWQVLACRFGKRKYASLTEYLSAYLEAIQRVGPIRAFHHEHSHSHCSRVPIL